MLTFGFQKELANQFQPLVGNVNLSDSEVFERNLLTVEVFFKDFNYEEIQEVPSYNVSIMTNINYVQGRKLMRWN